MFASLTRKVSFVTLIALVVTALAATYVITSVFVLRANIMHLAETNVQQIWLIEDFNVAITRAIGEARTYALSNDPEELAQAQAALAEANTAFLALDPAVADPDSLDEDVEQDYVTLYGELRPVFIGVQQAIGALATADASGQQSSADTLEELEEQIERLDDEFTAAFTRETNQISETVTAQIQGILLSVSGILLMSLLLTIGALVLLRRSILQPIQHLSTATTAIIAGNLNQSVAITSADEIGALQGNFNAMTARIREQTHDLEQQITIATNARLYAEGVQAELAAQLATIEEQRLAIREMSVPILPITTNTIVMPLVGALDSGRLQFIQERALQAIRDTRASYLILDITGVPVVDTFVAQGLMWIVQASRLLGTNVVLVGIRPEVAQAIVGLGVDLSSIMTRSTLQNGLLSVQ